MKQHETPIAQKILETIFQIVRTQRSHGEPDNLTHGETFMLSLIHHRSAEDGVRVSEIASFLRVTPSSVTQWAKGLESKGLVERRRADTDRRVVLLRATQNGREVMDAAMARMIASFQLVVNELGERDSATLLGLLSKTLEILDVHAQGDEPC